MKHRAIILTLPVLMLTSLTVLSQQYAVRDVTVIPMNKEQVLPHQTVIISNGVITAIGDVKKTAVPKGYQVVDGRNKFLMPGLFDMHTHFFYEQGENRNTCAAELKVMLANGLTTARILNGDPVYLQVKDSVKRGTLEGPELFIASPQFVGKWPWPGRVFGAICTTPGEAAAAVRRFKREGYDEIKITFMVERPVYDAIIQTAREEGIKVTGHVGPKVKLPAALAAQQQVEHMDEFIDMLLPDTSYNHGQSVSDMNLWRKKAWETVEHLDASKIPALVAMVKNAEICVTPTNYFFFSSFGHGLTEEQIKARPDYAYIPSRIKKERWEIRERYWKSAPPEKSRLRYVALRNRMTFELWKAGVKLMTGSDSPEWFLLPGFATHDELETFVKAGLTPFAALQTATINPATYLGISFRKGTVEKGKAAELLLLEKNPLDDIRNTRTISGIFHNNTWYSRQKLDQLLQEAQILAR